MCLKPWNEMNNHPELLHYKKNISAILIYMSQRHLLHHRPQAIYLILSIIQMVLFNILHFQWLIEAVMLFKNRLL